MKTNIYICPYHSRALGDWPFDPGDDPSFRSSRTLDGPLTWGVCRPQVRAVLQPGDIVLFFSFTKSAEPWSVTYRFCAVATVEKKVSQPDIWMDADLALIRKYNNLLIRPTDNGSWEHFEPGFDDRYEHRNWMWRLASRRGLKKQDFEKLNRKMVVSGRPSVGGKTVTWAKEYVFFSKSKSNTFVMNRPPVVAYCRENGRAEIWKRDKISKQIFSMTVGLSRRYKNKHRTLRSTHKQHAHPPIRFRLPTHEAIRWHKDFSQYLENLDSSKGAF